MTYQTEIMNIVKKASDEYDEVDFYDFVKRMKIQFASLAASVEIN